MVNDENKKHRKIFIEETIGSRNYFSYRADLMLYKIIIAVFAFFMVFIMTSQIFISLLVSLQIFLIFTLINKLTLERKERQGKDLLINKNKKEYFKNKLLNINFDSFLKIVEYFFMKEGYTNYTRIGKYIFTSEFQDEIYYIKLYKFHEGAEIEKTDIRNFISSMINNNIDNGYFVTTNNINDEIKECIKNSDNNIVIIDLDYLYNLALKYDLLPDENFFCNKIFKQKANKRKRDIIKNNILNRKKIIIYILAAALFYIISRIMTYSSFYIYVCYYFVVLTFISLLYLKYEKQKN